MNRRSFFKFLGIGAATAAVVPKMLSETHNSNRLWDMLPDEVKSSPNGGAIGGIVFFEQPREGYDYSIGVQTGDGIYQNPSVVSVMRVGNGDEPDEQVAEYTSLNQGGKLATNIAYIAHKYGEKCKDSRGPLIVIEQVQAPGDTVQDLLKIMGFTRFYKAVNAKGIKRDGWYTTRFSGPMMMDRFTAAVEEGWYKPKSISLHIGMTTSEESCFNHPSYMRAAAQSYVGFHAFEEDKRNV